MSDHSLNKVAVTMYMRWYVGDYLRDTDHLSLEQHGAYSMLLMKMWERSGWLPLDHDQLARLCRLSPRQWAKVWPTVSDFFFMADGGKFFTQKRLLEELEKAKTRCEKAIESGGLGGRTRAANRRHNPASDPSSNPTSNPSSDPSREPLASLEQPYQQPSSERSSEPPSGFLAGQGSGVRDPPFARDPSGRSTCTGYDLERWYGEERALAVEGALAWTTPKTKDGKSSDFAASLSPELVADVRPTMKLHFAELKAGRGKAGALENPTLGFGCWRGDFTKLRERLHGKTPAASSTAPSTQPRIGATDEAKAQVAAMIAGLEARNNA